MPKALTMSVAEYCALSGQGQAAVREDLRRGRIPHIVSGKRGLIRILTAPALARLGATESP